MYAFMITGHISKMQQTNKTKNLHSNLPSVKFPLHELLFNEAICQDKYFFHERNLNNVQCLP